MTGKQTFIIVGASLAGAKAAETLRDEGYDGRLVVIGSEAERPYERPPLSKDYLRGEVGREKVYVHGEDFYAENDIELRLGRTAVTLDTSIGEVGLDDGKRLRYDRLLIATGATPRRLSAPGDALDGVFYLRNVQDSDELRDRLDKGGSLVVVGAGWIGTEVAASARQRGLDVTVVDPLSVPLERVLGTEVGAIYRDIHADHGVRMLLSSGVAAIEGADSVERVRTSDGRDDRLRPRRGRRRRAPVHSARAGRRPLRRRRHRRRRAPADEHARRVRRGRCRHDALTRSTGRRIRLEHWANALHQGPAAARNMLGRAEPYDRVPYFFSDQYDVGMEYAGYARDWDRVVFRGDPASREFIAFWLRGAHVLAGMNVNVWDVNDSIARLIRGASRSTTGASPTRVWRSTSSPRSPTPVRHDPPRAVATRGRVGVARHALA